MANCPRALRSKEPHYTKYLKIWEASKSSSSNFPGLFSRSQKLSSRLACRGPRLPLLTLEPLKSRSGSDCTLKNNMSRIPSVSQVKGTLGMV